MKLVGLVALLLATGFCSAPDAMAAVVEGGGSHGARVAEAVQLVIKVTNTGPFIPHLGFVFRTPHRRFEVHKMTALGGCTIAEEQSAFDCGDLAKSESKTYSFHSIETTVGTFPYALPLRALVHPSNYFNDHPEH